MPYTPTEWVTGDTITAEKLNNIETGIAGLAPGEVTVAQEQEVNTSEGDNYGEAVITLADGYTLPETLPQNWLVEAKGETVSDWVTLEYSAAPDEYGFDEYKAVVDIGSIYSFSVFINNGSLYFYCSGLEDGYGGVFTVRISIPASGETYEPTVWNTGDVITAEKLNKIEDALADLNGYEVIAQQQSVTYTGDDAGLITSVEGYTVPTNIPEDLMVFVDGNALEYSVSNTGYVNTDGQGYVYVFLWETDPEQHTYAYALQVYDGNDDPVPGTYTVKIYAPKSDVPAGYVVVAPEQSVTIVDSNPGTVVPIDSYIIPESLPDGLICYVNGTELVYADGGYTYEDENIGYDLYVSLDNEILLLDAFSPTPPDYPRLPGTYTVAIYAPEGK